MDNQTACAVMSASETASDFKKSFICANDDLHQALLDSPLAIFVYVFGVLLVMFIVQRAAKPLPQKKNKNIGAGLLVAIFVIFFLFLNLFPWTR